MLSYCTLLWFAVGRRQSSTQQQSRLTGSPSTALLCAEPDYSDRTLCLKLCVYAANTMQQLSSCLLACGHKPGEGMGCSDEPLQVVPGFDAKGIETVRRDTCPAVAKTMERSLRLLFATRDLSEVRPCLTPCQCSTLLAYCS